MTTKRTDSPPADWKAEDPNHRRKIKESIDQLLKGRSNNTGKFQTAGAGKTSTTVSDVLMGLTTVVLIEPKSTAANTIKAATFISTIQRGSFVATHPDTVTSTFYYVMVG